MPINGSLKVALIQKVITRNLIWAVLMLVLLCGSAGTFAWTGAWIFVAEVAILGSGMGLWLAVRDHNLLREQLTSPIQPQQLGWDQTFVVAIYLMWVAWLVLMALDTVRYKWSAVPSELRAIGVVCLGLYTLITAATYRENSFAVPTIKVQKAKGHRVVASGPYSYVRHPIYASSVLYYLGGGLLLGSWCGVVAVPFMVGLLGLRAILEERALIDELDGYAEYMAQVPYRFVPLIW